MKRAFIFFSLVLGLYNSYGQNYASPGYLPPSPIAQAFKLYGDIPVSYSTGVPDISIPLYTIQAGEFSLPVILRYHLKSLRPSSCKTNVALGWTLDYGGMVSRTIYGRADYNSNIDLETYSADNYPLQTHVINNYCGTGSNEGLNRLAKKSNGPDTQYDIYNYNLNSGEGGTFIITGISNDITNFTQIGRTSVKIAYGSGGSYGSYDITNDKGVVYKFGYDNYHKSYNAEDYGAPSSWLLSQVAFPNNNILDFTYEDVSRFVKTNSQTLVTIYNDDKQKSWYLTDGPGVCSPEATPQYSITAPTYQVEYDEKNIKQIDFPNGKIVFSLSTDKKLITGLKVYNLGNVIKEYQFVLSSGLAMGDMKYLDKIVVKDKNASTVQEYNFQYTNPAYVYENATVDYWGYYNNGGNAYRGFENGEYAYTTYNPVSGDQQTYSWGIGGGQSKTASSECLINTLKKIIYPTKGEMEFEYEINQLSYTVWGDGPRIKKITTRDGNNNTTIKTYAYEIPADQYIPNKEDLCNRSYLMTLCGTPFDISSQFVRTTTRVYGSDISDRITASRLECHYDQVTETIGDNSIGGNNIGKNVYYFRHNKDLYSPGSFKYSFYEYRGWGNDVLVRKETYKKNETIPISVDSYDYEYHYSEQKYKNSIVTKITDYPDLYFDSSIPDPSDPDFLTYQYYCSIYYPGVSTDVYSYFNFEIVPGWTQLTEESHSEATPNGMITTSTRYEYNGAQPHFPSRIVTAKSDGTYSVVDKTYPYDYGSTEPYQTMTARNIITPGIEQKLSTQSGSSTTLLKATKTNYYNWGSNIIEPVTVQEGRGTSALSNLETRIQFDSYDDKGNVTAVSKANDIQKVYLWGYNKSYVVAEVIGATLSNILATPTLDMSVIENVNGTYTDAQVRTELNKIRSYLPSAQMITYTYNPLIGITSQTDINGRTTYYEYDAFGRLQLIKDKDGNVIKTFTYKYKQ